MILASIAVLAIVTQDQAQLRASARDSAQQQAVLWQGDVLEVRGEKLDYLQVYDHRRERAGYIKSSHVRTIPETPQGAAEQMAVVRFLRDSPGAEALGIAYSAAYLKAAPAPAIGAEIFDALGTMAERLARRASTKQTKQNDAVIAAHLEVATQYGVQFKSYEYDGRVQLCYEGEAFRRVMAMPADPQQKARAALALTRSECIDPDMTASARINLDNWRASILERVELSGLPAYMQNRIHMRRASVWSAIAFQQKRHGESGMQEETRALNELASVNKEELSDEDYSAYNEAGIRVGASRWAAELENDRKTGLHLLASKGQPGETCISLVDAVHDAQHALAQRCTYGQVWLASTRTNAANTVLTVAVQSMDSWRELWLLHQDKSGWIIDVLPPSLNNPDLAYVEFAGWVPGANKLLLAREARTEGRYKRSFEIFNLDTMQVENAADKPGSLNIFYKWQDPMWKQQSLSLR